MDSTKAVGVAEGFCVPQNVISLIRLHGSQAQEPRSAKCDLTDSTDIFKRFVLDSYCFEDG